jgi:hypothetical protein
MADPQKQARVVRVVDLENAEVKVTADSRLQVEFQIDDLISKLHSGGRVSDASCSGCYGCSGCSM